MSDGALEVRWAIDHVAETGSTNSDLMERARGGAPEGLIRVADFQRQGRGRLDRTWTAPAGSALLVSVLLRPRLAVARRHLAVVAVALAAADAAQAVTGVRPALKWPNDLLGLDDEGRERKLGGILAEVGGPAAPGADADPIVVGLGCNLNRPADFPAELADQAIFLSELAPAVAASAPVDRDGVLHRWVAGLDRWYPLVTDPAGHAQLVAAWRRDLSTLGREVTVDRGQAGRLVGTALDVDVDGALSLQPPEGPPITVHVGDVVHATPTAS